MKTFSTATLIATVALFVPTLHAQTAATLASPRPAAPPVPVPTPPPPVEPAPGLVPQLADQVGTLLKDATRTANDAVRSALKNAHSTLLWEADQPGFQFGAGARRSNRSLVVQASSANPERIDDLEEDLSVMARILQKAARSLREDDRFNAMGIDVDSSVFGSASGARNLYIEGHGALFLLSVKYPLVGSTDNAPGDQPAPPPDTEWERTREEVLGSGPSAGLGEHEGVATIRNGRGKTEPFEERKVTGLKLALLNALTNASNIRHLAPTEFVTVVVQGGDVADPIPGRTEVRVKKEKETRTNGDASRKSVNVSSSSPSKGESVMTLRVKKADLDSVSMGQLSPDQFRQKALVLTYLRQGDSGRVNRR